VGAGRGGADTDTVAHRYTDGDIDAFEHADSEAYGHDHAHPGASGAPRVRSPGAQGPAADAHGHGDGYCHFAGNADGVAERDCLDAERVYSDCLAEPDRRHSRPTHVDGVAERDSNVDAGTAVTWSRKAQGEIGS
jgi:hypothetical protein